MTSLTKKSAFPKQKIFFKCRLEDLSHLLRFFTRSVALTRPEKFPRKATGNPVVLARKFPILARRKSVKKLQLHKSKKYQIVKNLTTWEKSDNSFEISAPKFSRKRSYPQSPRISLKIVEL